MESAATRGDVVVTVGGERPRGKGWLARCVPLFRGFIAAVGINEGPCFHGDRVAVQISFYYLPRGIYLATNGGQGAVLLVVVVEVGYYDARHDATFDRLFRRSSCWRSF